MQHKSNSTNHNHAKASKTILWPTIALLSIIGIIATREYGIIDLNYYKSTRTASQTASTCLIKQAKSPNPNIRIKIIMDSKIIKSKHIAHGPGPTIELTANIGDVKHSGNNFLPLAKSFESTYSCNYITQGNIGGYKIDGNISGNIKTQIFGICSSKSAKELVVSEIIKNVASHLEKYLTTK